MSSTTQQTSVLDRFNHRMDEVHSLVCVGLDPDLALMPQKFRTKTDPLFAFNKAVIEATHEFVCAYKPNSAFYEAFGAEGVEQLHKTCGYLHKNHPTIPIILDAKRADIESTNKGYVSFVFDYLGADAVTLHPYLGKSAIAPFLDRTNKISIILCRTSNPGAGEFQDEMYQKVAQHVANNWNANNNCMLVVGATYPAELAKVRKIVGDMTLLIPGVGAQGGTMEDVLRVGLNSQKKGLIISISRGIIYAGNMEAVKAKIKEYALASWR